MCSMFYEANERPRHATTTVVIRSKPIAPVTDGFTSFVEKSYVGWIDKTTLLIRFVIGIVFKPRAFNRFSIALASYR